MPSIHKHTGQTAHNRRCVRRCVRVPGGREHNLGRVRGAGGTFSCLTMHARNKKQKATCKRGQGQSQTHPTPHTFLGFENMGEGVCKTSIGAVSKKCTPCCACYKCTSSRCTHGKWCTTDALRVFLEVENIAYRSGKSMKNYRSLETIRDLGDLPCDRITQHPPSLIVHLTFAQTRSPIGATVQ